MFDLFFIVQAVALCLFSLLLRSKYVDPIPMTDSRTLSVSAAQDTVFSHTLVTIVTRTASTGRLNIEYFYNCAITIVLEIWNLIINTTTMDPSNHLPRLRLLIQEGL